MQQVIRSNDEHLTILDFQVSDQIFHNKNRVETDNDILKAISTGLLDTRVQSDGTCICDYMWNDKVYANINFSRADNLWYDRFGKDYQTDIEQHVQKYRKGTKPYLHNIENTFEVVEKVDLLQHIIVVQNRIDDKIVFEAFHRGLQMRGENKFTVDFTDNEFLVSTDSFSKTVCRAALLCFGSNNEFDNTNDQSNPWGFTKTG